MGSDLASNSRVFQGMSTEVPGSLLNTSVGSFGLGLFEYIRENHSVFYCDHQKILIKILLLLHATIVIEGKTQRPPPHAASFHCRRVYMYLTWTSELLGIVVSVITWPGEFWIFTVVAPLVLWVWLLVLTPLKSAIPNFANGMRLLPLSKSSTIRSAFSPLRWLLLDSAVRDLVTVLPVVRFSMTAVPTDSEVAVTVSWITLPADTEKPLKSYA